MQLSALGSSSSIITSPCRKLLSRKPIGASTSKQASRLARTSFRDTAKPAMSMGKGRLGLQPVWKRTTFEESQIQEQFSELSQLQRWDWFKVNRYLAFFDHRLLVLHASHQPHGPHRHSLSTPHLTDHNEINHKKQTYHDPISTAWAPPPQTAAGCTCCHHQRSRPPPVGCHFLELLFCPLWATVGPRSSALPLEASAS